MTPAPAADRSDALQAARSAPASLADIIARQKQGWSLERAFYTDPTLFDLDLEHVWYRQWLFAGYGNAIASAGDYFLTQIADESLIIIRDQQGSIHALFNTCRHRGSRV